MQNTIKFSILSLLIGLVSLPVTAATEKCAAISTVDIAVADSVPPPGVHYPRDGDSISVYTPNLTLLLNTIPPHYNARHEILVFADSARTDTVVREAVGGSSIPYLTISVGYLPINRHYWWLARVQDSTAVSDWSEPYTFYLREPRAFYVPDQVGSLDTALKYAAPYDSVMIAPGVYPINRRLRMNILIQGTGPAEETVLRSKAGGPILGTQIPYWGDSGGVLQISNVTFEGSVSICAVYVDFGPVEISNCVFRNITAEDAVVLDGTTLSSDGLSFHHNVIRNCTIADSPCLEVQGLDSIYNNVFYNVTGGVACYSGYHAAPFICNNIFFNWSAYAIEVNASEYLPDIDYDLFYDSDGDVVSNYPIGDNCLHVDPLFVDPVHGDFRLQPGSEAIDAGDPDRFFNDPDGTRGDIGRYPFTQPTGVDDTDPSALPADFVLNQNYPNPFNPSTVIQYSLPNRSSVELVVFNVLGHKVRTLVDEVLPAGEHSAVWDGTDDLNRQVASGVYFYRLRSDVNCTTRKMVLLK